MFAIARTFTSPETARAAADKVIEDGYPADEVMVVAPPPADAPADAALVAAALRAGSAISERPEVYAEALAAGRTIVVVNAGFGAGSRAAGILDEFGPHPADLPEPPKLREWDDAAPLSSAFGIPTIVSGKPDLFSDFIGLPALSSGRSWMSKVFGELTGPNWFFSSNLLIDNPTPLSSMFGLPVLKKPKENWNSSFGLPLLTSSSATFSGTFGLPLLSKNPAPLSSALGVPTTIDD